MADTIIVVKDPTLVLQPLDAAGDPSGSPVDVSCDVSQVELTVDTPVNTVTTFCGKVQVPDDAEVGCSISAVVNSGTNGRWASLVGDSVEVQVKDRTTDTTYRAFTSQVPINPALYGPTTPGEARAFDFDMPVLSAVAIVTPS